jgi:hypothetical protein
MKTKVTIMALLQYSEYSTKKFNFIARKKIMFNVLFAYSDSMPW